MRTEHDFLGEMNVPDNAYYGVQTMRAMENFHITGEHLDPDFIKAMAIVKKSSGNHTVSGRISGIGIESQPLSRLRRSHVFPYQQGKRHALYQSVGRFE